MDRNEQTMTNNSDRWKIDGDCSKCRRQPYCKEACRLNNKMVTDITMKAIYEKTGLGVIMQHLERSKW